MHELFAQVGKGGGAGGGGDAGAGIFLFLCFYGVLILVAITIQVLFLLTISRCLKEIAPRNRKMEPGQVWLCLIPLFGFVWTIIMLLRVADSLKDEFYDRDLQGDGDYGKTLGIVYIVSSIICGIVGLVCFIMYWVKISGYTKQLRQYPSDRADDDYDDEAPPPPRRPRPRDEDDDDDRPSRRPR